MPFRFNLTALLLLACTAAGLPAPCMAQDANPTQSALQSQAFWIDRSTILIPAAQAVAEGTYKIYSDPAAHIGASKTSLTGKYSVALHAGGTLSEGQVKRFPQLAHGYTVLTLPAGMTETVEHLLLKGQMAVSVQKPNGSLAYFTGIQTAGVLDDLYAYPGRLGVVVRKAAGQDDAWDDFPDDAKGTLKVKVWAPTAQSLAVQLFDSAGQQTPAQVVPMHEHAGVWVAVLDERWKGKYYLLDEKVYAPIKLGIVENVVTDPYSIDIALNGSKSRLLDMDAESTKPAGWDQSQSPTLERPNDLSIYELHVRDFSVADETVPAAHRGMYLAFTDRDSDGMKHLAALSQAGLKAVHLLPTFHFSAVDEDKRTWKTTGDLSRYPPDGGQQQAAVTAIKQVDAYNWGYSPLHYLTPEGAYAVNPEDRVREYRAMVMALHSAGLRVIQDVVFNHTAGFGQEPNSVLDKVVPSYYNRLDADGNLLHATCCADTATEHVMMGKLQQDAIIWNAKHYKIDGFRFDLMGFTFIDNLKQLRAALDGLTMAKDGVDGSRIYVYGEGWDFGEMMHNALGLSATQLNLFGTGVGSFNDRLRDGVRGGTVTGDLHPQGFATGLLTDSSRYTGSNASQADQRKTLLHQQDLIRIGLTGNLRDYQLTNAAGSSVTGGQLDYNGHPAGYTANPQESINYVSAHDNQILFDAIQVKAAPGEDAAMRARRQVFAMSIVALAQGIPFFVAGDDLLRSKDMDGDSFDSGDWFNKIDWTGRQNNWGIGLSIPTSGEDAWMTERPLLAKASLRPGAAEIRFASSAFQELLRIRYSSGLFRMATLAEVQAHLHFVPTDHPGVLAMELEAEDAVYGPYRRILVVFNATMGRETVIAPGLKGQPLELHPVQAHSADPQMLTSTFDATLGSASVPALTAAVFVSTR